ncbi:hypothetical protein M5K25_003023 [Dendrobium thyrsiflorum]|uniref:Thioesterase domain-containing protein n=1 Tax=Dendrobium thyrsiflorum TaxID=117978 RepID=A0ABD0VXV4_DENTH
MIFNHSHLPHSKTDSRPLYQQINISSTDSSPTIVTMASRNTGHTSPPPPAISSPSKTAEVDPSLDLLGFEIDVVSAVEVTGRLVITDRCCQDLHHSHPPHSTTGSPLISISINCSKNRIPNHFPMASRNLGSPSPPSPAVPSTSKTAELDLPLGVLGFEIDVVSAVEITGHLRVTDHCCQVLHGGVSALISEGLASIGAHVASGFRRIAGIHLSVDHLRSAAVGDLVFARAAPVHRGRTIQVWEVLIWKMNQSTMEKEALITSSKVTFISNLPIPENAKNADVALRKYAKL